MVRRFLIAPRVDLETLNKICLANGDFECASISVRNGMIALVVKVSDYLNDPEEQSAAFDRLLDEFDDHCIDAVVDSRQVESYLTPFHLELMPSQNVAASISDFVILTESRSKKTLIGIAMIAFVLLFILYLVLGK